MGFEIDENDKNKKIIEGLNLFSVKELKGEAFLNAYINFAEFGMNYIKNLGYEVFYSTCSKKILPMYLVLMARIH